MKFNTQAELDAYIDAKGDEKAEAKMQTLIEAQKKKEEEEATKKKVSEAPGRVTGGEDNLAKDPKGGFKNLGDFAHALYVEKSDKHSPDPRLAAWKAACKALGTLDPAALGAMIPTEFSTALISSVIDVNPLLPRMTQIPMSTGKIDFPKITGYNQSSGLVYGGIKWYWLAEGSAGTEAEPKDETFSMTLHDLMGLCVVNQNLLDDSPVSIGAVLQAGFQSGLNFSLNDSFIRGTGAGKPLGILNLPALISVAKESAQAADTIKAENIWNMFSRIYRGDGSGLAWLINQDCFPQLAKMSLAVGTGGAPIWIPGNSIAGRPNDTLLGIPIEYSDHCSTLGDLGDIILANLSQYWVGLKGGGPSFAESIHLYFDHNQTAYRWTFRVDGRSPWSQDFKPAVSAASRSPFVTLAARA